jgi:hypothetical protein
MTKMTMVSSRAWTALAVALNALALASHCDAFAPGDGRHLLLSSSLIGSGGCKSSTSLGLGDFFNFNKNEEPPQKEQEEESSASTAVEEDQDPVEKIFGFFFGAKEDKPMGMDRFGPARFPEQYPAVKDQWADPLDSDDNEMAKIRPFLKNTNLETRGLRLTYDANRDGWDPIKFHQAVDKQGGAVVLCTTRLGMVVGGYNPKGWVG